MEEYISSRITNRYYSLTAAEKRVADFVLTDRVRAQYMSISELADECRVGEASITRFCRTLGLKGYGEFRLALAKEAGSRADAGSDTTEDEGTAAAHIRKALNIQTNVLSQTVERLDASAVEKAAEMLSSSRRVLCVGQGSSLVMAQEAWTMFSTVTDTFSCVMDSHFQAASVGLMGSGDALLCFSYSGSTKDLEDILPLAKEQGIKVILVTRYSRSPAVAHADVLLRCGSDESPLQQGSASARISQLFIIDVLFQEYCRLLPQDAARKRELVARALATKHF